MGCGPGGRGFGFLGGGGDGDLVAEGLQAAEVGAGFAVAVGLPLVPVESEVGEPGLGVAQQVPDDDQDRASDGASGAGAAEFAGQAAEPLAEECLGAGGAGRGLGA